MIKKIISIFILTLLLSTSLIVTGSQNSSSQQTTIVTSSDIGSTNPFSNALVRIDTTNAEVSLPRGLEIVGGIPNQWLDIIVPSHRLPELTEKDVSYSVLISDVDEYSQSFAGQYHTLAQIEQILEDIATAYPDITSLYSIGTTSEGRDIWCLEITDNPGVDEGEPGVFYMGLHHAREWPTIEICLTIAEELTSQYGSDPDITDVVNTRRLWLVTCVNPDGYYYSHDLNHDWRKNRRYFPEFGTYGVDPNRNYAGSSNGVAQGAWGSLGGGSVSHHSDSEVYCGPAPMSELEMKAVEDVFLSNDICACITWHTYGELVMWPWGYSTSQQAPDNTYLTQVGQQIASKITKQYGSGTYTPTQSAGLYPTTGDTTDWAYGYSHYVLGKVTFAYTIEACNTFQPSPSYLDQICEENFDGALYLLQEAEAIKNTVVPRVIPPEIDEMTYDPDGNYEVSWQQQNPEANPDFYQLDELTDLSILTDDAEGSSSLWELDGFSLSTTRHYSGSKSYKSRDLNSDVCSMTTINPLPINGESTLSFWSWYNIENNWDYAMVEVSRNGRSYDVLDTFTGLSSGWQYYEYDLSAYEGDSVFIRFRYTTDDYTTGEGFYVDDISPLADYGTITTLSDMITDESYQITGRTNGTYYYRVKGHNTQRDWGDFSTLKAMTVGGSGDTQPPAVNITTPKQGYLYFRNNELIPLANTIIIGQIEIDVDAFDEGGVERVDFYIDDQKIGSDPTAPYTYAWTQIAFFKHNIKAVAFDTSGNQAETEMTVFKLF